MEPSAAATSTPLFNPAATPVPGGRIQVISTADSHGVGGESVDGGEFQIVNTTASTESVSAIRLEVSEFAVFSSLTLTAAGGSATVGSPSTENEFIFFPPLQIPPGSSIAVTLSATIESAPGSSGTPTPTPSSPAPTPTATPSLSLSVTGLIGRGPTTPSSPPPGSDRTSRGADVLGVGIAMAGLLMGVLCSRRWRGGGLAGLTLLLVGVALYGGCGSEQTSEQSVTDLTVTIPTGSATMTGLPVSLGTVSRPLPLTFPGAVSTPQ